jgi:hypothetical protein
MKTKVDNHVVQNGQSDNLYFMLCFFIYVVVGILFNCLFKKVSALRKCWNA